MNCRLCLFLLFVSVWGLNGCLHQPTHEADFQPLPYSNNMVSPSSTTDYTGHIKLTGCDDNLWCILPQGYQLPLVDNAAVHNEIQLLLRQRRRFKRVAHNARPYLFHILHEIEARGMPFEIALLPIIESNFHPTARSPKHAMGLWQFIPSTGRHYGLKRNHLYDGRNDVVASTQAALTHLSKLHKKFNGDWLLALAAYNGGEYRVKREIERNREAGKNLDFWSLDLPKETQRYVPQLLAVAQVVAQSQHYGLDLPGIANKPYFNSITVAERVDLPTAAKLMGLSPKELQRLNSGYMRAVAPASSRLHLPTDKTEEFQRHLKDSASLLLMRKQASQRLQKSRSTTYKHVVRSGESLWTIARKYKTSVKKLRKLNRLRSNRLRIGRKLIVPRRNG